MGSLAWAFQIEKKRDKVGREIDVPLDNYSSLLIAKPDVFDFNMTVRGAEKKEMIERAYQCA